jgi:mRNA interferase HigB
VKVLGTEVLDKASRMHSDLTTPIATWLAVARLAKWKNLDDLRLTWRSTDCVRGQTIFNIKGNKYRLFATVNYSSQTIIVKDLVTHAEYSKRGLNK